MERYDPQSDEWSEVASLKSPRGGVGVGALGHHLYAAGGNDGSASLQTVERYSVPLEYSCLTMIFYSYRCFI